MAPTGRAELRLTPRLQAALLGPTPRSSHERWPGIRERRMKVAVSGLDLTRRNPRQPGGLPRSATTSHTDARQGPTGMQRDAHHERGVRPPAPLRALPHVPPCNVGLIRRDPPDLLAGLADRSPPRGLAHVDSAAKRRPGAAALDVRGSMGQQHPCAAVARHGVGQDARRAARTPVASARQGWKRSSVALCRSFMTAQPACAPPARRVCCLPPPRRFRPQPACAGRMKPPLTGDFRD